MLAQNTQLVGIIHEQNVTISEMRRTIDALNGRIQELERRQSSNYLNTLIVPILPTLVSSLTSCLAGRTAQPLTTSA
ncbi:MAG: hypothetical protein HYX48_02840 [Chlamydiales bacterium]|nr:hypothetical protein [Chlamydiales bacterium]